MCLKKETKSIKIKLVTRGVNKTPGSFTYGDAVFISDSHCSDYDWYVVYDELPNCDAGNFCHGRERLACPRERTMLLTVEPTSIKRYSPAYTRQFGHLLTNRPPEAEKHPHYHFGEGYFKWFYGKPYGEIVRQSLPAKDRVLSVICSAKQMAHTQHAARFNLIQSVCAALPECDWYGHGVKPLTHKYEALDRYKYSLAIENHISPGHWSEKIADVLLAEALPFYAGDPNLEKILPPQSFIRIPIENPSEAIRIIKEAIANNEYEKRLPAIREAKQLLLTKYNIYAQILRVIHEVENQAIAPCNSHQPAYLYNRHRLRLNPLVALSDGWCHLCEEMKRLFAKSS